MKRFALFGLAFAGLAAVVVAAFVYTAKPVSDLFGTEVSWVGCGISKKAYVVALAAAYQQKTGAKINLAGGGATRGIRDVAAGKADMGGTCRHLLQVPEEAGARLVQVGWDAVVVIVHPANPVSDISRSKLKDVFNGRITNWKELGGQDLPITVVARKGRISGVGRMVRELLFENPEHDFTDRAVIKRSSGPVEQLVEQKRHAIAFTGVSSAKKRTVKMLAIDGKEPSAENIARGRYILYRPLYLVLPESPAKAASGFAEFAVSDEGQAVIAAAGTVPLAANDRLSPLYRQAMLKAGVKEGTF